MSEDEFFIGWQAKAPKADRRFLLGASLGLIAAAGGVGASLGLRGPPPGPGGWNQAAVRAHVGRLELWPYPMLVMAGGGGPARIVLLATTGKLGLGARAPNELAGGMVAVLGSLIVRGARSMIAVIDGPDWISQVEATAEDAPVAEDLGEVMLAGEILDAKCWFGAMRPGYGKTHKACAALCARGGLPLAFCETGACGDGLDAPLFVDAAGRPHGPDILPFLADPVLASGRRVRFGDLTQFRVDPGAILRR